MDWPECAFTVAVAASGLDAFIHAVTRVNRLSYNDDMYELGFRVDETNSLSEAGLLRLRRNIHKFEIS
jgi:hypothetical protein